ncbi:MAG TPA: zf-HC2 domain-containing protein [Anaeromyxobacter sp.]|nr:zf-HC2 domain-containing protein [Anaeromyxobacter sp.]
MTCRDARTLFSARLDGRLGPDEARALDAHLAACAACRGELARWEAAAGALRAAGPTPVPPSLAERAFRAATRAERPAPVAGFLPAGRKAALAGALAAAAVWIAALATGAAPRPAPADAGQDPIEVAVLLWTAEGER